MLCAVGALPVTVCFTALAFPALLLVVLLFAADVLDVVFAAGFLFAAELFAAGAFFAAASLAAAVSHATICTAGHSTRLKTATPRHIARLPNALTPKASLPENPSTDTSAHDKFNPHYDSKLRPATLRIPQPGEPPQVHPFPLPVFASCCIHARCSSACIAFTLVPYREFAGTFL
jgi:hypothetical protein